MMNTITTNTKKTEAEGGNSQPTVIADAVSKIIKTKNPKTRYSVGKMAKPLIFLRNLVGDKMYDKMVTSQLK